MPVIVVGVIFVISAVLLRKMTYGTLFYALGSNEVASKIAGAPVRGRRLWRTPFAGYCRAWPG